MAFKLRRGLETDRLSITPAEGEPIYTTDEKKLYIGDGSTVGGNAITGGSGSAIYWQILAGETVVVVDRTQYPVYRTLDLRGTISLGAGAELIIYL
jgi:hypothetical protein